MKPTTFLSIVRLPLAVGLLAGIAVSAHATFHLMQIEQVMGGVNGDTTAQAVQLRLRNLGENQVQNGRLIIYDATGTNAITLLAPPVSVTNNLAGDRVLIASSNFVNQTSPATAPDFYLTNLIPASYLAAGRLTWQDTFGTVYWSVSWGGTNYTGPTTGATLDDADGNFGPSVNGPLPSTGTSALLFTNTATALSRSNIVDYIVTPGPVVFTNNHHAAFVVINPPQPVVTAIVRETDDIRITWSTVGGKTNLVQATAGDSGGDYTNNFADISPLIIPPGTSAITTNYLDVGGATNKPARYYRVRLVP